MCLVFNHTFYSPAQLVKLNWDKVKGLNGFTITLAMVGKIGIRLVEVSSGQEGCLVLLLLLLSSSFRNKLPPPHLLFVLPFLRPSHVSFRFLLQQLPGTNSKFVFFTFFFVVAVCSIPSTVLGLFFILLPSS